MAQLDILPERWAEWLDHKDDLANLQLLQGLVNEEKSDKEFETWLLDREREPENLAHYCDMHMIPPGSLELTEFPAFLAARRDLLRRRLRDALQPEQAVVEPVRDDIAAEDALNGGALMEG